ncbi:hypothetical protein VZT92_017066 [Zoarces viviparus]|uniref:Uncharacterized protein n=1 Tax=Zoarces viviparus TaxID=48416 RepID=A0AAW1EQM4_ZOAVI
MKIKTPEAKLARYKDRQAGRGGNYTANTVTTNLAKQPLQYDVSPWEGNFTWNVRTNIACDGLTIEVIHYRALIMAPPQSFCESPSTPVGFGGGGVDASDDCEDEWMLAEPRPSYGERTDLIHYLQICLASRRA